MSKLYFDPIITSYSHWSFSGKSRLKAHKGGRVFTLRWLRIRSDDSVFASADRLQDWSRHVRRFGDYHLEMKRE